jgi:hypothetical protein
VRHSENGWLTKGAASIRSTKDAEKVTALSRYTARGGQLTWFLSVRTINSIRTWFGKYAKRSISIGLNSQDRRAGSKTCAPGPDCRPLSLHCSCVGGSNRASRIKIRDLLQI